MLAGSSCFFWFFSCRRKLFARVLQRLPSSNVKAVRDAFRARARNEIAPLLEASALAPRMPVLLIIWIC